MVWFCTWGLLTFPVTSQTARALRRWNAGQKICGVSEIFLVSAEGSQSECWSKNCSWMWGSVPMAHGKRLLLSCTKVRVIDKFLKWRVYLGPSPNFPWTSSPLYFLRNVIDGQLFQMRLYKIWWCAILYFFHMGNVKVFVTTWSTSSEEDLWPWLQMKSSTVYCISVFLRTRQIHSVCVCLGSLIEQRE